jgi:hypothetical protein
MTRAGEHLYLGDDRGLLDPSQGWAIEVEACAHHGGTMPERVVAISLDPLGIRDLTAEFESAVRDAMRPEAGFPSSYVIREGRAA